MGKYKFESLAEYNHIKTSFEQGKYVNKITNNACSLGKTKIFSVADNENLKITMKCTQIGGMFTGNYCFVPIKIG